MDADSYAGLALTTTPPSAALPQDVRASELQRYISYDVQSVDSIWETVRNELPQFDEGHTVSCISQVAALGYQPDRASELQPELATLLDRVRGPLARGELEAQNLAKMATALSSMSLEPELLVALEADVQRRAAQLGAIDVSSLARTFAQLRRADTVEALVAGAADRAQAFGTQALVNLTWAAATVRSRSGGLEAVLGEAAARGERLKPQGLANLVWALGALRETEGSHLRALLPHVAHRVRDLAPQGLANCLWGIAATHAPGARVGWLEDDAVMRLAAQSMRRIEDFGAHELTSVARAAAVYATAGSRGGGFSPLLSAVVGEAQRKLADFSPRDLGTLCWAMAAVHCRHEGAQSLLAEAARKAEVLRPHDCCVLLRSAASLNLHRDEAVLETLAKRIVHVEQTEGSLAYREISGVLWSHAYLRIRSPSLLDGELRAAAAQRAGEGTLREVVDAAWAAVQLGPSDQTLMEALARQVESRGAFDLTPKDCSQAALAFACVGVGSDKLFDSLCREFLAQVAKPFQDADRGAHWVDLSDALHMSGAVHRGLGSEVEAAFREAIFEPALRLLDSLRLANPSTGGIPSTSETAALKKLGQFANSLGLLHLGVSHTEEAMRSLDLASPVAADRAPCPAELSAQEQFQTKRLVRNGDLAWLSFDVTASLGEYQEVLRDPGQTFESVLEAAPRHELQALWISRARCPSHAERVLLLRLADAVRAAERRLRRQAVAALEPGTEDAEGVPAVLDEDDENRPKLMARGHARLVAADIPCLSCLAVLVQFKKLFPGISLEVTFGDARLPHGSRLGRTAV